MDIPSSVFAEILGRVETGVYGLNLERKVVYWNHGAERITGYLEQEVLGRALCKDLLVESEAHNLWIVYTRARTKPPPTVNPNAP